MQIAFSIKIADSFVDDFTYGINLQDKKRRIVELMFRLEQKFNSAVYLIMSNTSPQSLNNCTNPSFMLIKLVSIPQTTRTMSQVVIGVVTSFSSINS